LDLAGLLKKECYFVGFMNNESWFFLKMLIKLVQNAYRFAHI